MTDSKISDKLIPAFKFGEPNKSAHIANDEACIKDKDGKVLGFGTVEVRLDLLPRPWIRVHVSFQEELNDVKRLKLTESLRSAKVLELTNHECKIKGTPIKINYPSLI